MRLYISDNKYGWNGETESAAWKEKKLTTELRAICICSACASLILPLAACFVYHESEPYSCQSWADAGRWKPEEDAEKGGQESKEPGKAVGWWPAANLGFEWPSYLPLHSDTEGSQQKKKRAMELCLHVSSQRQSIVEKRRGQNWLKVVDHKWRYWFWGQSRRMRSWNKLK